MRGAGKSEYGSPQAESRASREAGSVLIVVLWISVGLVSLALYFAHSMSYELRASDNRVSAQSADQAIEGAARYISYLLATQIANGSNGCLPGLQAFQCEAVPVGEAHFWIIGRDTTNVVGQERVCFGLVDEASKLNLNTASTNALSWLPRMTADLTQAIVDWRDTNGNGPTVTYYAMQQPPYQCKCEVFETVDELRLLYGADMEILAGEDANRNGVLDPSENDENQNKLVEPGTLEYVTVYSREPNTNSSSTAGSSGSGPINITSLSSGAGTLMSLLQTNFGQARAAQILNNLGLDGGGGPRPPGGGQVRFPSPLLFYARSGMTPTEYAQISASLTTSNDSFTEGRVNINTASEAVLTCLLEGDTGAAQQLVNYRQNSPDTLGTIAWVADALGQNYASALQTIGAGDYITTRSYQFTADIAALGPHGRGYRRVKFVFDTSGGTPQIVYRQDLTHLGWALGPDVREKWLLTKGT